MKMAVTSRLIQNYMRSVIFVKFLLATILDLV